MGDWRPGLGLKSMAPDADDLARERLDEIRRARIEGRSPLPRPAAIEIQPYRTWFDKLFDFFRG